jgi:FKBP-type peptidyl-prolyl cis-trans isomerase 2
MNRTDAICLLVVILIIVGVISALTYSWYTDVTKESEKKETPDLVVREGDLIAFDFTEYIWTRDATGRETYCVYQTTLAEVAEDDSKPKCITFEDILINETGTPLTRESVTAIVGPDLSTEINPGFNQLILNLGLKIGDTKSGTVSYLEGYGERNESLVVTIPLTDSVNMYETIDRVEFESIYPEEIPLELGQSFEDKYWGWMIRIESITEDIIQIKHEPELDMTLDRFIWSARVVNISSATGLIWLEHYPDNSFVYTPIDIEVLEFYDPTFTEIKNQIVETQQPYPGIIISVTNEIKIDFNRENIGKNLKYDITILEIERD